MTAVDRAPRDSGEGAAAGDLRAEPLDAGVAQDAALLERLRAGEDAAFGELFARHSAAVRRLALRLVNDRAEAEDLTAEAFFRVLQAIRRGAGPVDNVRGYLLIVARRVAWEWRARHRDVPVSQEELTHRVGADPDACGESTERNLITRAFTSLPERWRSVLWKVEVEGERPAVVATNFGLSANATAALARRARQGLRAAYLQAHLAADRSNNGCRDVLEKLGAYTAGSLRGGECRRVRAHLTGCPSCAAMHAELCDVCSGLRAHAALLAVPLVAVAGPAVTAAAGGCGATVKALLASAKMKVTLATTSAAVVGLLVGPWGLTRDGVVADDLDGKRGLELVITGAPPAGRSSSETIAVTTGALSTAAVVPRRIRREASEPVGTAPVRDDQAGAVPAGSGGGYDEGAQLRYRQTTVDRRAEVVGGLAIVYETTKVTEVNSANQTRVSTVTTQYTKLATDAETFEPRMVPEPTSSATLSGPISSGPTTTTPTASAKPAITTTTQQAKAPSGTHPGVP